MTAPPPGATVSPLNKAATVALDASGNGTATLGPDDGRGPATWDVTGVLLLTSRPGVAPIPRCAVYRDSVEPSNLLGLSYDGSFSQGAASDLMLSRGQKVIAVWTGGKSGDSASITLTGVKW